MESINSAYKSKTIYMGSGDTPSFFPLTNFLTPKKKAVPLFLPKSPIPFIKRAVFFPSFFFY